MEKRVAVLGATGSIGKSTLSVLRAAPAGHFVPVLFSAHRDLEGLLALHREFPRAHLALSREDHEEEEIDERFVHTTGTKISTNKKNLLALLAGSGADVVVNGISGVAGLEYSLAALGSGADLALANKETIVAGGRIAGNLARAHGARIIPVDSEHSALFSLLEAHRPPAAREGDAPSVELILTASGGPFLDASEEELFHVTPECALQHPTWKMGRKISVDSATLANKGLEIIEAARLFDVPPQDIRVVIHRQSIAHSFIRLADGSLYAELSSPDMRLPIHKALYYPERIATPFARLELPPIDPLDLKFEKPDGKRFPMLPLAHFALCAGELYTVAYNAANEVAVECFLSRRIGFMDIPFITQRVLEADWSGDASALEIIMDADARARADARLFISRLPA